MHGINMVAQIRGYRVRQCPDQLVPRVFMYIDGEVCSEQVVCLSHRNRDAKPLAIASQVCRGYSVITEPSSYCGVALRSG